MAITTGHFSAAIVTIFAATVTILGHATSGFDIVHGLVDGKGRSGRQRSREGAPFSDRSGP
jgi:hypothetical protein